MRRRRGAALIQVLMFSAFAGLICALILRARLAPAMAAARQVNRLSGDFADQSAVNVVAQAWMRGGTCASDAAAGVMCRGGGAGCDCVCDAPGGVTVTGATRGGACDLRVASADGDRTERP